ncbi:unnamed protein product, partial [Mesorhabditis spiculigera]
MPNSYGLDEIDGLLNFPTAIFDDWYSDVDYQQGITIPSAGTLHGMHFVNDHLDSPTKYDSVSLPARVENGFESTSDTPSFPLYHLPIEASNRFPGPAGTPSSSHDTHYLSPIENYGSGPSASYETLGSVGDEHGFPGFEAHQPLCSGETTNYYSGFQTNQAEPSSSHPPATTPYANPYPTNAVEPSSDSNETNESGLKKKKSSRGRKPIYTGTRAQQNKQSRDKSRKRLKEIHAEMETDINQLPEFLRWFQSVHARFAYASQYKNNAISASNDDSQKAGAMLKLVEKLCGTGSKLNERHQKTGRRVQKSKSLSQPPAATPN